MTNSPPAIALPALLAAFFLASAPAHAEFQDEIQVYDDGINAPGAFGTELHVNTTPSGRSQPGYPGEVPPLHALRLTPEFSWSLRQGLEAGLYVPTILDANQHYDVAGAKVRLKWLPLETTDGRGWFGGINLELSRLAKRYSESRWTAESRFMAGYRNEDWLFVANPILDYNLSDGLRGERPDFNAGIKASRKIIEGLAAGLEYYADLGLVGQRLPWQQQDHRLYVAIDVDRKPWIFNLAVGRGLTDAADRWTVKAIFEIPL